MKKCLICGKELKKKQKKYCSHKCRLYGLNHKSKAGRPSLLSEELMKKLCDLIRSGVYVKTACQIVGIGTATYYEWMKRGRIEESSVFSKFLDSIKKAEAEGEGALVLGIRKDESWQSKAWLLERKYPDRWGRKDKIEHEGGMKIKVDVGDKIREIYKDPKLVEIINDIIKSCEEQEEFFGEDSSNDDSKISGDVCE
jgi:hypothetical protein